MRKGQNPAKQDVPAYQPEKLAIASLLSIPVEEGYFAQSWDIFEIHLSSVHQYTPQPFNYVVFDNNSCPRVKRELVRLHEEGWIDWLVLSDQNLGKTGALNWLIGALPNEWICYADSDMLFRPGWLEACMKIDEAFPNCGMIGAQVVFPDWEVDKGNTQFRNIQDAKFKFSQVKPEAWILDEYCRGRGISEEREKVYRAMLLDQVENSENGETAFLGGNSHQQWLSRREIIRQVLPLPANLQLNRQEDTHQDRRLDELNYLHLTTTVPYLYHMGNTIDEELKPEIRRLNLIENKNGAKRDQSQKRDAGLLLNFIFWMNRQKTGHRLLMKLYHSMYTAFSNPKV